MVKNIGGSSRALIGPSAAEGFLKRADLDEFGIVHFAAHAVLDRDRPERSAVVLAPGGQDQDGFLQIREIVDLDLAGKVIILSSCRSASGTVLRGEGVLGLARAFFQAGARAVVGSLWPMRDDEARTLIVALSERLAEGRSLASAVAAVRTEMVQADEPTDAWASLVVLGDGDMVPIPDGGQEATSSAGRVGAGVALMLLLAGAVVVFLKLRR
jgi:CHAT domain-containing protein